MENMDLNHTFWRDRPTFITGATGLVGSWLLKKLYNSGADITCLVRDWVPRSESVMSGCLEKVKVVRGDIVDRDLLERALGESECSVVFHLAAQTIVPIANRNPISTFETNIRGSWNIFEAARRTATVKGVVFASSDKAYGEQKVLPYTEESSLSGAFPYDVSKSCADMLASSYASTYKLPIAITRCGNFFGGGDLNFNRIIPGTIRSVLRQERPIIRSDGKFIRDYFYVEDGALAYMQLAEKLVRNPEITGEAFNFSYGQPMDVLGLVTVILAAMKSELVPQVLNEASHEIREQYLSSEKAKHLLNWDPQFDLPSALKETISWYEKYLKDESQ